MILADFLFGVLCGILVGALFVVREQVKLQRFYVDHYLAVNLSYIKGLEEGRKATAATVA